MGDPPSALGKVRQLESTELVYYLKLNKLVGIQVVPRSARDRPLNVGGGGTVRANE